MRQLNNIPDLLKDDFTSRFIINDIELHVPPTAISVHKEGLEYSWKTLRSKVSTKVLSGNGVFHAQISITFPADSIVLLHRLISQVRNNPFVMVENNFLSQSISDTHKSAKQKNYFTLFGFNISNHPSSPGAFLVELDLRYFNYKPYGNLLNYKKDFVHKTISGEKVFEYVHSVFPPEGAQKVSPIKKSEQEFSINSSSRTSNLAASHFEKLKIVPQAGVGITSSPKDSNAYKRYCNFLQLKYLKENFGITIGMTPSVEESVNRIVVDERIFNLLQGIGDKPMVGLHELKSVQAGNNHIKTLDDDLIELRRNLTHAILMSGLNTKIVVKEYISLELGGNFLFRYRKTLNKGTVKANLNEAKKQEKIKGNRDHIHALFNSLKSEKAKALTDMAPVHSGGISVEVPSAWGRDYTYLRPHDASGQEKYYPPGNNVVITKKADSKFTITDISESHLRGPASPVLSMIPGEITHNGTTITVVQNKGKTDAKETVYEGVTPIGDFIGFFSDRWSDINPAGTILGYFPISQEVTVTADPQIINDMLLSLTGKGLNEKLVKSSKEYNKKIKSINNKFDQGGNYLNSNDAIYMDRIKKAVDEENYHQYMYRAGLENVFQRARLLSYDSNFFEKDVESITGIKTNNDNHDSIPKFEQDITNVSCSLRNIISSIPILGHEYPTHQFLGSIEPVFQFNFIGKSHTDGLPPKIKELESIRAHVAYMAKNFPQIPDAGNIIVESLITKLVGSFKYADMDEKIIAYDKGTQPLYIRDSKPRFIISSTDTFTIEGSPGAVGLNFRFSESKPYDEEELREAVTSDVDEKYLDRYASIIRESDINVNAPSSGPDGSALKGEPIKHSYSKAKYVPFHWNTRYFSASKFYGKAKRHLRGRLVKEGAKNALGKSGPTIDENAYKFYLNFMDPLQDLLNEYGKLKKKSYKINVFSTLDAWNPGKSRKTKSNHFTGAAADIRISNMNAMEASALIELLEERRFFNDVFGPKRRYCLGVGIYGSKSGDDLLILDGNGDVIGAVPERVEDASRYMGRKPYRANGFIHLDANFDVTTDSIKSGEHGLKRGRRRWVGKGGADAFQVYDFTDAIIDEWRISHPQYFTVANPEDELAKENNKRNKEAFWGSTGQGDTYVKRIKDYINNDVRDAIVFYTKKAAGDIEASVESDNALEVEDQDETEEGEVANKTSGAVPETREKEREENYKITSTKPDDFIKFLRENKKKLDITDADIASLYREYQRLEGGKAGRFVDKIDYNFEITDENNNYEIKFLPRAGETSQTESERKILAGLKRYYGQEMLVRSASTKTNTKANAWIINPNSHKAGESLVKTVKKLHQSSTFKVDKSELTSKTAQRDAMKVQLLASNTMLKSFTELASVILTEPYLYTNTKEEFIKEMQFIQSQLYGFSVLPAYYNVIEKLFTGKCTVEAGQEALLSSRVDRAGVALGVAGALVTARGVAAYLTAPTGGWSLVGQGAIELIAIGYAFSTGLSDDAQVQLNRVRSGLKYHILALNGRASFQEYVKYFKDNKSSILGDSFKLEEAGVKNAGEFLEGVSDADQVAYSISQHIKPIYADLSIFNTFNKVAGNLDPTSRAMNLIQASLKGNSNLIDDDGIVDKKLSNFALADRITIANMKEYLQFLYMIPEHRDDGDLATNEQDARTIIANIGGEAVNGEYFGISPLLEKDSPSSGWTGDWAGDSLVYVGGEGTASAPIRPKDGRWVGLDDEKKYPYLFTYQNKRKLTHGGAQTEKHGVNSFFQDRKAALKSQQRTKLAYLRSLLKAILDENLHLNADIVEKTGDATLLRVLDGATVFELLETNSYPDIDLPQDPRMPYNNSNLSPCFYYHDQNDTKEILLKDRQKKEMAAANKIIDSSIQFQKGLRAGIFTGSEEKLRGDKEEKEIVNELVDSTEILRTVSDFLIGDEANKQTPAYIAPIAIALNNNDKVLGESTPIALTTSAQLATTEGAQKRLVNSATTQIAATNKGITGSKFDEKKKQFGEVNSMFGSQLGFKTFGKMDLKAQVDKVDPNIKRTIGLSTQQKYNKQDILDICEDSSGNINKLRTIKEAFPTFRLYIVEEDAIYTDRLTAFDDFFYYNSVISFNVHNSRELASSVATIQVQNISGLLDGTKKNVLRDVDLGEDVEERALEDEGNFIDSIVLRPGVTVQLRAGYESNSNELDILISGKIADINYAQNNTICNLTVQSFGVELEALRKGGEAGTNPDEPGVFYSTHQLLGSMMMSDELKHFGRSKVGAVFQIGEFKDFSLDLDLYKKESSFNFSLSRGFFDWVRDNTFGIGIGVGVLTLGLPALKMAGGTKLVKTVGSYFQPAAGGKLAAFGAATAKTFAWVPTKLSWANPFGVNKVAQQLIIKRAQTLATLAGRPSGSVYGPLPQMINTFDDALEFLIKAGNLNTTKGLWLSGNSSALVAMNRLGAGMQHVLQTGGKFAANQAVYGRINGTVVTVFKYIANVLSGGKVNIVPEMGEEFLKSIVLKHKGFGALGLSGVSPSRLGKAWLGMKMGGNIIIGAGTSIPLPLAIGVSGFATAALLSGLDVIIDSAKYAWNAMMGSFAADKNKLKKKKLLSPQDDNIFAPHPAQYMSNLDKNDYSYFGSLWSGYKLFGKEAWLSGKDILNTSTFGLINISSSKKLETLKLNPFKLIDKRMDVNKYENPFVLTGQTIWQILHECTLRHPGYIYGVRPYGNSLEYRVFFGVPNQRYWCKRITNTEIRKLNKIFMALDTMEDAGLLKENDIKVLFPSAYAQYKESAATNENLQVLQRFFTQKAYDYYISKTKDRFVPFRQFHLVSSKRNLIGNNIIVSSHNMINAVSVNFINTFTEKVEGEEKGSATVNSDVDPSLSKYNKTMETLKFRANNNVGMSQLKEKTVTYRNIVGASNAVRYGLGELLYGTRKMYEGSLTILGDTKINPWDVVILHDDITNMYGPVEVCSVTHMFSFETGFITDIETNALVTANEELSHPVITQSLVYETRAKVFDEYNSLYELGGTAEERKASVKKIVEDEVEEFIEEEMTTNAGFFRKYTGTGLAIDFGGLPDKKRKALVDKIVEKTMTSYEEDGPSFLRDFVPGDAAVPKELTDMISDVGLLAGGLSLTYLGGEALRNRFATNMGVSIFGGGLWKMGLFFAGSVALAKSSNLLNSTISTSYSSGRLGKNLFRQHIMSRMENGNLIQLYPLIRDGMPLVTGGFEEVDESEKWNNMLGYIFNATSTAVKGYLDRQQELKSYGKDVITAYDNDELTSMKSSIVVNATKVAKAIGITSADSLLGYMYLDD